MKPTIRDLDDGSVVVDYGRRWFRCQPDGQVIAKIVRNGKVEARPATSRERLEALGDTALARIRSRGDYLSSSYRRIYMANE